MKLAIPDLFSSAYFPVVAAKELGSFQAESIDIRLIPCSSSEQAFQALKNREVDFVGASAHSAPIVFPDWEEVRLLCALQQGMHLGLILSSRVAAKQGDLKLALGQRIGVAKCDAVTLQKTLSQNGVDPRSISAVVIEGSDSESFNTVAIRELAEGRVDGLWADSAVARVAQSQKIGSIVFDVHRGHGARECFNYTFPTLATSERFTRSSSGALGSVVRAIVRAQKSLKSDPRVSLAVAQKVSPQWAAQISDAVKWDSLFYDASLSRKLIAGFAKFAFDQEIATVEAPYERIVAVQVSPQWIDSRGTRQNRTGAFGE